MSWNILQSTSDTVGIISMGGEEREGGPGQEGGYIGQQTQLHIL